MDFEKHAEESIQLEKNKQEMVALLMELSGPEGIHPTPIENVRIIRANAHYEREPVFFDPCIVILASGCKKFYLGAHAVTYDPSHYFVLSVPLHFECETLTGDSWPLLGVAIRIDLSILSELVLLLGPEQQSAPFTPEGTASAVPLGLDMSDAVTRLLRSLRSTQESTALGPGIVREIIYRVLCGSQGKALIGLLARYGTIANVLTSIHRIHTQYADELDVAKLSASAGMSPSVFHHQFKALTMTSPMQYLKTVRLQKARMLMIHDRVTASVAASRVGYESPSQFNREFKRYFGNTPVDEVYRMRRSLGLEEAGTSHSPLPRRPDRHPIRHFPQD